MSNQSSGAATKMAKSQNRTSSPDIQNGPKLRTTLLISEHIDRWVEVCAAVEGKQKSEIVNQALYEFLKTKPFITSLAGK
jgi:6-phosphogluconolactonase/glucosamine-6-phosphate isomerase/deaminase